jgi:hypothetical protein
MKNPRRLNANLHQPPFKSTSPPLFHPPPLAFAQPQPYETQLRDYHLSPRNFDTVKPAKRSNKIA